MATIVATANIKGGVGKTTTALNLAAALSERGRRSLLVDLDPQASLTLSLGFRPDDQRRTIRHLLDEDEEFLTLAILSTPEQLDLIPANIKLRQLEHELGSQHRLLFSLRYLFDLLRKRYDYIVLDCPPSAGALTGAALAVADKVVVPMTLDFLSVQVTRTVLSFIQEAQEQLNPALQLAGVCLTMYDSRVRQARILLRTLHKLYGPEVPIFSAAIPQNARLKEAPSFGQSILKHAPRSQPAQAYRVIAQELEEGTACRPANEDDVVGGNRPDQAANDVLSELEDVPENDLISAESREVRFQVETPIDKASSSLPSIDDPQPGFLRFPPLEQARTQSARRDRPRRRRDRTCRA